MTPTGADTSQIVQTESFAASPPEVPVGAVCAEGPGKLNSGERWPELSGLLTVDFGLHLMAAIAYLTGVTLVGLGIALILR